MGKRWQKFADRKIYINHTLEISVGRLFFLIIMTVLLQFNVPIAWALPLFSIKKKGKENELQEVSKDKTA